MEKVVGQKFDDGMAAWQAWQDAPWGKLRYRIAQANLEPHLPQPPAKILDLGGGNGLDAIPLAQAGFQLSVLDLSAEMIAQGQQIAEAKGIADKMTHAVGNAEQLADHYAEPIFDVVLCHNVLQYVEDVTAVLQSIHNTLKPNGTLSLIITNPYSDTFGLALREYDLKGAIEQIGKRTKYVKTFDTIIQRYTDNEIIEMLRSTGFTIEAQYGIRTLCDYMADNEPKYDPDFYQQLEALEMAVRDKRPYLSLAHFYHFIGQKS